MANNGWRALIYDAEWARFKRGQEGVIVSEDGRMCETLDDNRDNIEIEADPNLLFLPRTSGHILFKQKGTDLFDIVCIEEEPGGTLALEATDTEFIVCNNGTIITLADLANKMIVTSSVNGGKPSVLEYGNGISTCTRSHGKYTCTYKINSPSEDEIEAAVNSINDEHTEETLGVVVEVSVEGQQYVGTSTMTIRGGNELIEENKKSKFYLSNLVATKQGESGGGGEVTCSIVPNNVTPSASEACNSTTIKFTAVSSKPTCNCSITKSKPELECKGGQIMFVVNCDSQEDTTYYVVDFSIDKLVETLYDERTCAGSTSKTRRDTLKLDAGGNVDVSIVDGATLKATTPSSIELYLPLNATEFTLKLVSNELGFSCDVKFVKDNDIFKPNRDTCISSTP